MIALFRYYPRGILLVANRGVERERVARRLRHQQRELETHRYKLQRLKKPSEIPAQNGDRRDKELRIAIKEERRKIRHRKERIRRLTSRMERLDRRKRSTDALRKGLRSVMDRLGLPPSR